MSNVFCLKNRSIVLYIVSDDCFSDQHGLTKLGKGPCYWDSFCSRYLRCYAVNLSSFVGDGEAHRMNDVLHG